MSEQVILDVYGTPRPQGSKRGYVRGGRAVVVDDNKAPLLTWREDVKQAALAVVTEPRVSLQGGPVEVEVMFFMPRPLSHYGTGRNAGGLKASAPEFCDKKPDLDKLIRSTLDALKDAGVYRDDGQVVQLYASQRYTPEQRGPGAWLCVQPVRSVL